MIHNLIIKIEKTLTADDSFVHFAHEARQWGRHEDGGKEGGENDEDGEDSARDKSFIDSEGEIFCNTLIDHLLYRSKWAMRQKWGPIQIHVYIINYNEKMKPRMQYEFVRNYMAGIKKCQMMQDC